MSNTRKRYSREFKIEAVRLSHNSDKTVEAIAETLDISKSSLSRWRKEFREDPDQAFPGNGQQKERDEKMARLEKKLKEAEMEIEILKKAVAIFTRSQR
jgi:transposase